MKKISLLLVLLTLTSCNLNSNNKLVLPKTVEEVKTLITKIPNCLYEIEDVINTKYEEEVPSGAQITLICSTSKDFFLELDFLMKSH